MTDTVVAHHDYEAQQDDELSFVAGDIIKVTDHSNTDWWLGTKQDGSSGYFPSNFVDAAVEKDDNKVTSTPITTEQEPKQPTTVANDVATEQKDEIKEPQQQQSIGMARVMEDYAMQEDDELTLHKGGIVVLYERSDDGVWLKGEINGKQGRFPAKYVEDIDMPGRPDLGVGHGESTSGDSTEGTSKAGPPGGFKLAAFGVKQGGIGSVLAGGFPTLKKTSTSAPKAPTNDHEETSTTTTTQPTAQPTDQTINEPMAKATLGKAIVLHPYNAENQDELNLIRGEYIEILDRNADEGWWEGRNEKNQTGVFPSNFVKEIEHDQQAPPPPVRSRKSVASVGAATASPIIPSESRPFSTPASSLQRSDLSSRVVPPPIQRLPPLPDSQPNPVTSPTASSSEGHQNDNEDEKETIKSSKDEKEKPSPITPTITENQKTNHGDNDSFEFEGTPVGDSQDINVDEPTTTTTTNTSHAVANVDKPDQEKSLSSSLQSPRSPAKEESTEEQSVVTEQEQKETVEQPQQPVESIVEEEKEKEQLEIPENTTNVSQVKDQDDQPQQEKDETTSDIKDISSSTTTTTAAAAAAAAPALEKEPQTEDEVTNILEKEPANIETTNNEEEIPKKNIDLAEALPTSGPRLTLPSRTSRPSNRASPRRPPTNTNDSPSQTELLQQELEKAPEEEKPVDQSSPSSPPPKPIKPIFAKFPTPFAMGGEGISAKNLKPVQRRMFEPAPAHESTVTTSNDDDKNEEPRPTGGVRGLASRFAGIPPSGGGNEVLETKLKNFTKNEVDKVRKEFEKTLSEERAKREALEQLVNSLVETIDQLQKGSL